MSVMYIPGKHQHLIVTVLLVVITMMMMTIPIEVTLVGIVTDVSPVHPLKTLAPYDNDNDCKH